MHKNIVALNRSIQHNNNTAHTYSEYDTVDKTTTLTDTP